MENTKAANESNIEMIHQNLIHLSSGLQKVFAMVIIIGAPRLAIVDTKAPFVPLAKVVSGSGLHSWENIT